MQGGDVMSRSENRHHHDVCCENWCDPCDYCDCCDCFDPWSEPWNDPWSDPWCDPCCKKRHHCKQNCC